LIGRLPFLIFFMLATISPLLLRGQDKLRVIDRPTIAAESLCNPDGNATGSMILGNDTNVSVPVHLSAGDLSSKSPNKQLLIQPTLTPKDTNLDSKQDLEVKIGIVGLYEDGDWQSTIENDGTDVGAVRIVRTSPPFALSLDVATPDAPELTFVKGETGHFRLKNADPREYQILWQYSINGYTVGSTDSPALSKTDSRSWIHRWFSKDASSNTSKLEGNSDRNAALTLPPRGQQEFTFDPPLKWFGGSFACLFKDKVADGRLTVSMVSSQCPQLSALSRTFNVKTTLVTSSGARREGRADFWVFVFLALGGIFSLSLNSLLPNQMRRSKMKQRLSSAGTRISSLSYDLASRLRVLVGQSQRLITDRLRNLTWTSPDFSGEMQDIEQAMTRLETRLQFLERLSMVRTNFIRLRAQVLPSSVIFSMEATFDKIVEVGEKSDPSDPDVQTAVSLIKNVEDQLAQGILGNVDFVKSLAGRVATYKTDFNQENGRIGKTDTCKRIRVLVPGPFARLESVDETKLAAATDVSSAQDYMDLDGRLFELEMIREYVDMVEGLSSTSNLRTKITGHEGELLDYLSRGSYEAAYAAKLLLKEMTDGFFKEDIQGEIEAERVRIRVDRGEIRRYQPCEFRLEFLKLDLNTAYARQEWGCRWFFMLGEATLIEEGWVITHYFAEDFTYKLKVALTHNVDGSVLPVPDVAPFSQGEIHLVPEVRRQLGEVFKFVLRGNLADARKEWKKGRRRSGKTLDYVRLAMALVIALFGLIAGAKEQLLKLDLLPALLAIFMVGFGADQIKNLLTQKTSVPDTSSSH
jgi:hypothetical protein